MGFDMILICRNLPVCLRLDNKIGIFSFKWSTMGKRFYGLLAGFLVCLCSLSAQAQYGFEWIRTGQPYYKFGIAVTGVYKLDSAVLASAGINLAGIDPARFQLFRNGVEQPVYIHGEADGVLNAGDFIEFFGVRNDGSFDTQLYTSPDAQPHPWYSLFSDTSVYFLTILPAGSPVTAKRYALSTDQNTAPYTPEPYYIHEDKVFPVAEYVEGINLNVGRTKYNSSEYTEGEGWADTRLAIGKSRTYSLSTPFLSPTGPQPAIDMKVIGVSDYEIGNPVNNHHVRISVARGDNLVYTTVRDFIFKGYIVQKDSVLINAASVGTSETVVKMEVISDLPVTSDFNQLSYVRIAYPRLYNLGGVSEMQLTVRHLQPGAKTRLAVAGYGSGAQTNPRLYDFRTGKRIIGSYASGTANLLLDKTGQPSDVYLFDSAQVTSVTSIAQVQFKAIDPAVGYEYIIVTHPRLNAAATDYETYRSRKYRVLKVFSSELYDYYCYGNMHPLAVRRMADHLLHTAPVKPQFLALLGKGYQNNIVRRKQYFDEHLVPVIGMPASDVMFTTGLNGDGGFSSDIPTGRVPAFTNEELNSYLQKLIYYETNPDTIQLWRKNYLHISGGEDQRQQDSFKAQLAANKATIRAKSVGANVISFNKTSTDPTQQDEKGELTRIINNGVTMLTFLGHGSATVIDMDFGSLQDLRNQNKYTFFYFNGCNIGNPSEIDPPSRVGLYGKDFICEPDKGAIGWLGHSNLTFDTKLFSQMNAFHSQFGVVNYGQPIAKIISAAGKSVSGSADAFMQSHFYQLILMGDPAVKIYSPELPDYTLENSDLFMYPDGANAQLDSVAVGVILTNLGRATDDTVTVTVTRTLPNNTKRVYEASLGRPLYYKDTMYVWMPVDHILDVGNNTYEVTIDKSNLRAEISKLNNTATFTFYMPGTGIRTLLPVTDGIVTADSVQLVIQNNDLFKSNTEYFFEIDTTPSFNSAALMKSGIVNAGSVARWKLVLTGADSTVYFWRARMNVPETQGGLWDTASFTLIRNGAKGWSQSRIGQYRNAAEVDKILFSDNGISFVDNFHEVIAKQARWQHAGYGILDPYALTPNVFPCVSGGIVAIVYDGRTLTAKDARGFPRNCTVNSPATYYTFDTKIPSGQQEFARLVDSMNTGDYLALYTSYNSGSESWGPVLRGALGRIGSAKVAAANNNNTCGVLIGKKGEAPGMAYEDTITTAITPNDTNVITVNRQLRGKWYAGSVVSGRIGPAKSWRDVQCAFNSLEAAGGDRMWITVIAENRAGQDSVIVNRSTSLFHDISFLSASTYPYLRLKVEFEDSVSRTPNQFGRWSVHYDMPPEGSINPILGYSFYNRQLQQGDSLRLDIAFENLTDIPFDSLPVALSITDAERVVRYTSNYTEPILPGNTYRIISHKVPTEMLSGSNVLQMSVNGKELIPEVTFGNNFMQEGFEVIVDRKNPMLDVTFDGYRIMNGDFVSPTPVIRLLSKDENRFRIQKDTSTFDLFIRKPSGSGDFEKINMTSSEVTFIAANGTTNTAMLDYKPQRLPDGTYTLRVQSKDATGNSSGKNAYEIDFKVINESTITNFFPYPNPGTTNIRFVFTLTGSRPPEQLLVRIMTITGKVVREITGQEFGPIKIGNNISQFAWDGTDNYGDRLANGVYLYQVYTRIDGQSIKKRDLAADQFMLHNTGKIYLLK
jgi:hypothetical protein